MKKYLFLAAAAAMFAACSNEDVLVDGRQPVATESAISFSTFNPNMTRAENSGEDYTEALQNHHSTFAVWGYKNTAAIAAPVFNGDVNTWNTPNAGVWNYSPDRYWDKAADKYEFYAAAPSAGGNGGTWTFVVPTATAQDNGYFTTKSTLTGTNITKVESKTTYNYVDAFGTTGDVDLMIADKCPITKEYFNNEVTLKFIHILSRLNIDIQKQGTSLKNKQVLVKSLEVCNLNVAGDYNESTVLTDGTTLVGGTTARWSNGTTAEKKDVKYTATALDSTNVKEVQFGKAQYVLQSLIIPQTIKYEDVKLNGSNVTTSSAPYFKMVYSIQDKKETTAGVWVVDTEKSAEEFTVYYNLAGVFSTVLHDPYEKNEYKYAMTPTSGTYAYVKGGSYYPDMTGGSTAYENVVFKNGDTYTRSDGTTPVYYYNNTYYTTKTDETNYSGDFTPGVVILATGTTTLAPKFLTNAEAAAGASPIDAHPATCNLAFNEGWQNNLHIIFDFDSNVIKFVGQVAKWDDNKSNNFKIQ